MQSIVQHTVLAITGILIIPILILPPTVSADINDTRADAWGDVEVTGADWMGGAGVDIRSNGPSINGPSSPTDNTVNNINGTPQVSGEKWQCVELINRLYLAHGWIMSNWQGYGNTMINNVPANLTKETQNYVTSIQPGDVIAMNSLSNGHVAVVDSVNGNSFKIASQNTKVVYDTSFSLVNGTINKSGWDGYTIQGVIHAPIGYQIAYTGSGNNQMHVYGNKGIGNTGYTVSSGTSPSITTYGTHAYQTAYRNSSGFLTLAGAAWNGATTLGVEAGTSPSITTLANGDLQVAFVAAGTREVYLYGDQGMGGTGYSAASGTSPSITKQGTSSFQIAFQDNLTNRLGVAGGAWAGVTGYGITPGTNPDITTLANGGLQVTFRAAGTGQLYLYGDGGIGGTPHTVEYGTSPSITKHGTSSYQIAFHNLGTNTLYVAGAGNTGNTTLGISSGSSPNVSSVGHAGYQVAFSAAGTGYLYLYGNSDNGGTTNSIAAGTNPSME